MNFIVHIRKINNKKNIINYTTLYIIVHPLKKCLHLVAFEYEIDWAAISLPDEHFL